MYEIIKLYTGTEIGTVLNDLTKKEAIDICNVLNDKYSFKNSYYTFKVVKISKDYIDL
tara:strand:- start:1557 stop:1730 length:174 start_codon:yes stop_codon:yes gene_type:complete